MNLYLYNFPTGQRGLIFRQNTVLQSVIKVVFLFLKMRGHPVKVREEKRLSLLYFESL